MTVFDVHAHLWSPTMRGKRYMSPEAEAKWFRAAFLGCEPVLDANGARLVEALDRTEEALGADYRVCVFAIDIGLIFPTDLDVSELNDWVAAQALSDDRKRIIPFACVDPRRHNALGEVERCVAKLGARGVKLYPPAGFYPDDERFFPFYEGVLRIQRETGRALPLLFHQGFSFSGSKYGRPVFVEEVAFRFKPDLKIVLAHAGIPWTDEAISIAALHRNVSLDIALYGDLYGFWPELHLQLFGKAKRAGVLDRIMFGSDWPLSSAWMPAKEPSPPWAGLQGIVNEIRGLRMPESLGEQGYPEITPREIDGILGGNALRLFE